MSYYSDLLIEVEELVAKIKPTVEPQYADADEAMRTVYLKVIEKLVGDRDARIRELVAAVDQASNDMWGKVWEPDEIKVIQKALLPLLAVAKRIK
jgi:hypothetical protein